MIALLAAAVVTFPGGTTNDLVKSLREATNQDAVIVRSTILKQALPPISYDPGSADNMNSALHTGAELKIVPGAEPLFSDERIAPSLLRAFGSGGRTNRVFDASSGAIVQSYGQAPSQSQGKPLAANAFDGGKITFKTEGSETLDMNTIQAAPFPKRVEMSWVYIDLMPSVDFRGAAPSIFLQKIAKGVGSRFRETDKAYLLELNPEEFRHRAERSMEALKIDTSTPEGTMLAAKLKLSLSVVRSMSTQSITEAFASPSSSTQIALTRNSGLQGSANDYLQSLERAPQTQPDPSDDNTGAPARRPARNGGRQVAQALRNIDPRRDAILIFSAQFQCQIEIPTMDANGRSTGMVRF